MNILVIGCGRLGAHLAQKLDSKGHEVSIISQNRSDLDALENFKGFTVVGVPIDEDVLQRAGIENCDAVAVVTSDDNINLMVSQMAKILYNVSNITIRVFESSKKNLLKGTGIKVLSPTSDSTNIICDLIITEDITYNYSIGDTIISVKYENAPKDCLKKHVRFFKAPKGCIVFGILKAVDNKLYFYDESSESDAMIIEKGDRIVLNKMLNDEELEL